MTDLLSAAAPPAAASAPTSLPPGVSGVLARIQGIRSLAAPAGVAGPGSDSGPDGGFAALLAASQDQTAAAGLGPGSPLADLGISGLDPSSLSSLSSIYTSSSPAEGSASGSAAVEEAAGYLGVPYLWGGTDPASGLDCSGLVQLVYSKLGASLPRTSQEQAQVGQPVASLAQAQPGDLIFYGSPAEHVGIYIGNGKMIDAPHTGTRVRVDSVGQPTSIRRVLASSPGTSYLSGALGGGALSRLAAGSAPGQNGGSALGQVPSGLAPVFLSAAARHGLSPTLLAAVAKVESGFDPTAVSPAGAEGLMQLMPSTAAGLGVDPMDPAQAVDGAARMLSDNLARFGSLPLALAAYNAGPGAVEQYGGVPPYPETQQYVQQVMSLAGANS